MRSWRRVLSDDEAKVVLRIFAGGGDSSGGGDIEAAEALAGGEHYSKRSEKVLQSTCRW